MANEVFDKETLLDLTVNFIPLGIIAFFILAFAVFTPWGFDPMASTLMFGIMGSMLVGLAALTYLSGKAIAGAEKTADVYSQGQAFLSTAEPAEGEADGEVSAEATAEETAGGAQH